MNLFLLDGNTSLLENMVVINLLRKYGRNHAVYFYKKGIEFDFYVPDAATTAIQVCYDPDNRAGTFDREVKALLKIAEVLECRYLLIITRDTERMLEMSGKKIEAIPVWKWLLNL